MSAFTPFTTGLFDSDDYNKSNYGEIQEVDKDVIGLFLRGFDALGIKPRSIHGTGASIGAGPSPIDDMLLSIFLSEYSLIRDFDIGDGNLIEIAFRAGNGIHVYEAENVFGQKVQIDTHRWWGKFDEEILKQGVKIFKDPIPFQRTFQRSQRMTGPAYGDINRLDREMFAIATMFYCFESATDDVDQAEYMLRNFFLSLQPGAPFCIAAVIESEGYSAGKYTEFPAVNLTKEDYHGMLSRMPIINVQVSVTPHTFRPGHGGVIVMVGQKMLVADR